MSTATVPRLRASRDANFASKAERRRVRKSMARAAMANYIAEKRTGAAERAEFYRNLRHMKMRRRRIAEGMFSLSVSVEALHQEVRRVSDRLPSTAGGKETPAERAARKATENLIDECIDLAKAAGAATSAAADEWHMFARRKIYFTELVG